MVGQIIQPFALRRDTAIGWSAANPVLEDGQEGYETDTRKRKVGDGVTAWGALPYDVSETAGGGTTTFPVGMVIRIPYDTASAAYPAEAGPTGALYEYVGPVHPGALLGENDSWVKTEA